MDTIKDNENPVIYHIEHKKLMRKELEPCKRWRNSQHIEDISIWEALNDHATLLEKCGLKVNIDTRNFSSHCTPLFPIRDKNCSPSAENNIERERIDAAEVFEHIRNIQDPEHPLSLEQLNVVTLDHIQVNDNFTDDGPSTVEVRFT